MKIIEIFNNELKRRGWFSENENKSYSYVEFAGPLDLFTIDELLYIIHKRQNNFRILEIIQEAYGIKICYC